MSGLLYMYVLCVVVLWSWLPNAHSQSARPVDSSPGFACSREFLFFEFTSSLPPSDVKEFFKDVNVLYSFKVLGAGHYIFVVYNDQSEGLRSLTVPKENSSLLTVFPVETITRFFTRFNVPMEERELLQLADQDLNFVEGIWNATGLNEAQYAAALAETIRQLGPLDGRFPNTRFASVAELPTKLIGFWNLKDCDNAAGVLTNTDPMGGPGGVVVRSLKIHNI